MRNLSETFLRAWRELEFSHGQDPSGANSWSPTFMTVMPLILAMDDYARWLGDEPDPRDLMRPFPAEPMRMWPISTPRQQAGE